MRTPKRMKARPEQLALPTGAVPPRQADSQSKPVTLGELESHLWEAANILRGSPVDRTDWKSYNDIVQKVRFKGWQQSSQGEREVKQALRKTLFKYKLHQEEALFEKAYGYVRQYY